ncbi:ImmA/IrrE family metallo-endopeptidase [Nitrosomonas sp.]|uniref:ImmA/IrrE family metallo-endopeptidase n=1 Tax=Nitrosomonas sp. TaxID=42353 RepID=UPI0025F9910F|nr:ImmA/IrrE family metallo-endopeptidase [Nitrosomonas sp.]MBV6448928.1 IS1595 family transposase ISMesp1 [Nitrosomonas sp.]
MRDALSIIQSYLTEAPVNIEGIIRSLGIELDKKADLDDDISGQIERLPGGSYKISVNKKDHYFRQRFTMAHELAHFLFHRSLIGDGVDDSKAYRSTNKGKFYNTSITREHETQANQFAASILMPESLVLRLYDEFDSDLDELSKKLQASKQAISIRLTAMNNS